MTYVEKRLIEWAKSLHCEPWNYWPSVSVLGRIRDEGAGASQGTAQMSDGGLGDMVDRMACGIEKDRRCAEMREAYNSMPPQLSLIVDSTDRLCASARDVPRSWQAAVEMSGLSPATYFRRKKKLLAWLASFLCMPAEKWAA